MGNRNRVKILGIVSLAIFFTHSILLAANELLLAYNTLISRLDALEIGRYFQLSEKILRLSSPISFIYLIIGLTLLSRKRKEEETSRTLIAKRISLIYLILFSITALFFFFGSYESFLIRVNTLDIIYGLLFIYTLPFCLICFFLGIAFLAGGLKYKIMGVLVAILAYYGSIQFLGTGKRWIVGLFGSLILFFYGITFFIVGLFRQKRIEI